MRKSRACALLLTLPFVLLALYPARAATTPGAHSKLTPQQEEYQNLLKQEFDAFTREHPDYLKVSAQTPEALKQRRDLSLLWQERAQALLAEFGGVAPGDKVAANKWDAATEASVEAAAAKFLPNEGASNAGLPEQNNASVQYSEAAPEAYGVWTEHSPVGFGVPPTLVWYGGTPIPGSGVAWPIAGGINAPMPPVTGLPESWNASIGAVPPIGPDQYYAAFSEWAAPALVAGPPSAIVTQTTMGAGLPFPSGTGPSLIFQGGGGNWVDYPYLIVDDHPGNPGPPGLGDVHVAWVEYNEGGDGDADGNGNWFDDPADFHHIWVASANTGAGPQLYPAWGNYWVLWVGPTAPLQHQTHRPALAFVGPFGTPGPAGLPPSGVYAAWHDGFGMLLLDASPQPGSGAPWVWFGGGPIPITVPVFPLPPVLNGNIRAATNVTIAVDNSFLFPGMLYAAWSDYANGDADIMFTSSPDGGLTWTPAMRVNQDPIGNGLDQWAPHMVVDVNTGEIKITYYDRRNDPAAGFLIETFASTSLDGGMTWTDWLVSDAGPQPPLTMLTVGSQAYMGDYLWSDWSWQWAGVGTIPTGWGAIWNDARNGIDQDVYFENVQIPWGSNDSDGDGWPDAVDNCPAVFNPNQAFTITITGDVNNDGSITAGDIVWLVNYVFKSGPAPLPCTPSGDVNCDGFINAADVIYVVNHVFKSGPLPCNICLAFGLGWTCP